jgi:hypothetical protein
VTAPQQIAKDGAKEPASVPGRNTIITQALLGSDAGLIGAARLPMIGD